MTEHRPRVLIKIRPDRVDVYHRDDVNVRIESVCKGADKMKWWRQWLPDRWLEVMGDTPEAPADMGWVETQSIDERLDEAERWLYAEAVAMACDRVNTELALGDLRRSYLRESVWLPFCALCWDHRPAGDLELAHIVSRGRAGKRANVACNVLFLCHECHESHHRGAHTSAGGERWPDIRDCNLVAAKAEMREINSVDLATIAGRTVEWVIDQVAEGARTMPEAIRDKRKANGPMHSKGFKWRMAATDGLAEVTQKG